MPRLVWTPEKDAQLLEYYQQGLRPAYMAQQMGLTVASVEIKEREIVMNYCEVLIAIMFGVQMFTLFLLWEAVNDANHWKRNAIMRDPKTGRFLKRRK
jgi:hypothetical protein